MLLMDRLLDRLLPWNAIMLVCLLDDGRVNEQWSSGDKMADQGRSLVPLAAAQRTSENRGVKVGEAREICTPPLDLKMGTLQRSSHYPPVSNTTGHFRLSISLKTAADGPFCPAA